MWGPHLGLFGDTVGDGQFLLGMPGRGLRAVSRSMYLPLTGTLKGHISPGLKNL
jgi:hypothetical protein